MAACLFALVYGGVLKADEDHDRARRLLEAGKIVSLEEILEIAKSRFKGHLLEVELEHRRGRYYYEIEMVDEKGVVLEMYFDAETGKLLKVKRED